MCDERLNPLLIALYVLIDDQVMPPRTAVPERDRTWTS